MLEDGTLVTALQATDGDGDPLSYSLVTDPQHGCAELDPDTGVLTYRPNSDFTGQDTLTFQVNDGAFDMLTGGVGMDLFLRLRLDRIIDVTAVDLVL